MIPLCTKYLSCIEFHFLSHRKKSSSLSVPLFFHLTCTYTNPLATGFSDLGLKQARLVRIANVCFVLFTSFQRTSPNSSLCEMLRNFVRFHGAHSPSTKLEHHSLSAVSSYCSHVEAAFSIRNLKMRHVVATNL